MDHGIYKHYNDGATEPAEEEASERRRREGQQKIRYKMHVAKEIVDKGKNTKKKETFDKQLKKSLLGADAHDEDECQGLVADQKAADAGHHHG